MVRSTVHDRPRIFICPPAALAALLLANLAAAAAHDPPSADMIVARYVAAIGGQEKLDAIQNVIIRGTYSEHGQSGAAQLARMRPFYKLVGDPLKRSKDFEEGYDGSAWEFYGDPGIVFRTVGPASAAARHGLYILGNQERDDAQAVHWTYHDFRNAYPATNTEVAMEIIGYQALKMGSSASAILLLEFNERDYPNSAAAAFGLGRAYQAAGRTADAAAEFKHALSIDPNYERAKRALADAAGGP
jgi:tetratricopeptide (TPR) repeat protein